MQRAVLHVVLYLCLYVNSVDGQSIKFYDMNVTQTVSGCDNGTHPGDKKVVLSGEAHLPKHPNLTSYIFFDMRSDQFQYNQLCFVDTSNNCQDNSVIDICYCTVADLPDTYKFYLDITAESKLEQRQITGFLLFRNSSKVLTEKTLTNGLDSTLNPVTEFTINGKPVQRECDMVMQGNVLELNANCHSSLDKCWLHLQLGDSADPIVNPRSVSFKKTYSGGSHVLLTLSRSICDENRFEKVFGCNITFVSEARIQESGLSNEILAVIIGSVAGLVLVGIIVGIVLIVRKKKYAKKKPLVTEVQFDPEMGRDEMLPMMNRTAVEGKEAKVVSDNLNNDVQALKKEGENIKSVIEDHRLSDDTEDDDEDVSIKIKRNADETTPIYQPDDDDGDDDDDDDSNLTDEEEDEDMDKIQSSSDDEIVLLQDTPLTQIKELLKLKGVPKKSIKIFDEVCKELKLKKKATLNRQ